MAYSAPPNFAAGAVLTEADLDTLSADIAFLADPPSVRVRAVASQSVGSGNTTTITWEVEDYDNYLMHSTTTNTSRLTVPVDGLYDIKVGLDIQANAGGYRNLDILENGAVLIASMTVAPANGDNTRLVLPVEGRFVAGNYVEARFTQNSGATLTVHDGIHTRSFFSARWVGL